MEYKIEELLRDKCVDNNNHHDASDLQYSIHKSRDKIYTIAKNNAEDFLSEICDIVHRDDKKRDDDSVTDRCSFGTTLHEICHSGKSPIFIEFTVRIMYSEACNIIGEEFIEEFVRIAYDCIGTLFKLDEDYLECIVLKSDVWSKDDYQCERIRFHFPQTLVSLSVLNEKLLDLVMKSAITNRVFSFITETVVDNFKDMVAIYNKAIPMYGAKPNLSSAPLYFHSFYKCTSNSIVLSNLNDSNIDMTANYSLVVRDIISSEMFEMQNHINKYFWLPLICSIHFWFKETKMHVFIPNAPSVNATEERSKIYAQEEIPPEVMAEDLIKMVSEHTMNKKHYWFIIGQTLFNIFNGRSKGLKLWKYYTKDIELLDLCEETYETFQETFHDVRTIAEFARYDNEEQYEAWKNEIIDAKIVNALSSTHNKLSEIVYYELWLDYIYVPADKAWYRFKNHKLFEDIEHLLLSRDVIRCITYNFTKLYEKIGREMLKEQDPAKRKVSAASMDLALKIVRNIENNRLMEEVIKSAKKRFLDPHYKKERDENVNTMCWKNGTLEIFERDIVFRRGRIQDYITKTTGINFPENYTDDHPSVILLMDYFGKLHTNPVMLQFFLHDQASYLLGGNPEKWFRNFIGESDASKSQYVKLLQLTFGEYCVDLNDHVITKTRNEGAAPDPELDAARGARLAIVSETSVHNPIDGRKVKKQTGNDRIRNRTLHDKGGQHTITYKLLHMSNIIAKIPDADEATMRRMIIYLFESKWVTNPPEDIAEQYRQRRFKMDPYFYKLLPRMAPANAYLMYKYFRGYMDGATTNPPDCVTSVKLKFEQENDPIWLFIQDRIKRRYIDQERTIPDPSVESTFNDVYGAYKEWFESSYPRQAIMEMPKFRNLIYKARYLGQPNSQGVWIGLELII